MTQQLPQILEGTVTQYAGNGRKLGYPTANIATYTALADGVYFGYASLGDYANHPALIFVGTPTTVGDTTRRVEAHLLDIFDKDYYGLNLRLDIQHFHRPNRTLNSLEELILIMKDDESVSRRWFKKR